MRRITATVTTSLALAGATVLIPTPAAQAVQAGLNCETERQSADPAPHCLVLIPTDAAGDARGIVKLYLAQSPFGLPVSADGHTIYDIRVELTGLDRQPDRSYIAWVTTTDLKERAKLGVIGSDLTARGRAAWNRFMVVVSEESTPDVDTWTGPILFSASSPSGWLSTMMGEPISGNNELPVQSRYCLVNKC